MAILLAKYILNSGGSRISQTGRRRTPTPVIWYWPSATKLRRLYFHRHVCPQGRGLPQCMLGYHPLWADTLPGADSPPGSRHPPGADPPWSRHPPPQERQLLLQMVCILLECILVTGQNQVLAKVIFLHLSVILLTGGSTWPGTPLQTRQVHPPPDQVHPPRTRQVHPPRTGRYTPWDQAGTPPSPTRQVHPLDQAGTPPQTRYTPPGPGRYTPSPQDQAGTPPQNRQVHPPGTRQVHPPPQPGRYTPWDQVGTPPPGPGRYTPPQEQQTPEYGQRSAGTHPTGMHSCYLRFLSTTAWKWKRTDASLGSLLGSANEKFFSFFERGVDVLRFRTDGCERVGVFV